MEQTRKRMTQENNLPQFTENLQLPPTDLAKLTFCAPSKPVKVRSWADALRATKTSETSVVLYKCVPELSRLKTDYESRLEMLEAVRPAAQHAIESLAPEFLNQPINLSRDAQKAAIIAQAIQKAMIDGYTRCVLEICQQKRFKQLSLQSLSKALHRAITGIGLVLFRSYQLYAQPPAGFWLRLHALFQIADYFDLLDKPVLDPMLETTRATNLQTAYVRVLLLATAKLNQVSQKDISQIFYALETWAQYARLHPGSTTGKDVFCVVNLSGDYAPTYKSRFEGLSDDRVLQLDFNVLVSLLTKHSPSRDQQPEKVASGSLAVPVGFPPSLVEHLIACWSHVAQRQQERRNIQASAEICVGLVNVHYFVSGEQPFEKFANSGDPLQGEYDTGIMNAITSGLTPLDARRSPSSSSAPTFRVNVQNISAGGCCLLWKDDIPSRLQAGELVGIKESGRHSWSIGVIRWIRQFKGASQLGIQTLANHPKPGGAAQLYDMGGYSDYMRAFYIPASRNGQTPPSVLVAQVPFKEMDKVKLFDGESATTVKLTSSIFATGSVRQFTYHPLDGRATGTEGRKSPKAFDDDWD